MIRWWFHLAYSRFLRKIIILNILSHLSIVLCSWELDLSISLLLIFQNLFIYIILISRKSLLYSKCIILQQIFDLGCFFINLLSIVFGLFVLVIDYQIILDRHLGHFLCLFRQLWVKYHSMICLCFYYRSLFTVTVSLSVVWCGLIKLLLINLIYFRFKYLIWPHWIFAINENKKMILWFLIFWSLLTEGSSLTHFFYTLFAPLPRQRGTILIIADGGAVGIDGGYNFFEDT